MKVIFLPLMALLTVLPMVTGCSSQIPFETECLVVRCEDQRQGAPLQELARMTAPNEGRLPARLALAAGRIGDFELWTLLCGRFGQNPVVGDALAVATLFPGHAFPKEPMLQQLQALPYTPQVCQALLGIDTAEALDLVLKKNLYTKTISENIWRSRTVVSDEQLSRLYRLHPHQTTYSLARLRKKNLVKTTDLAGAAPFTRVVCAAITDDPASLLNDADWRVRVAALRMVNDPQAVLSRAMDENPLVVSEAFGALGRLNISLTDEQIRNLTPMSAAAFLQNQAQSLSVKGIFARGGLFARLAAPHMPPEEQETILAGELPLTVKLQVVLKQDPQAALSMARDHFTSRKSVEALQFLLENDKIENLADIIEAARPDPAFQSVLIDANQISVPIPHRDESWYREKLRKIRTYSGFTIHLEEGDIRCRFLPEEAPLTVLNFIELAEKGYFNNTRFHRVVPAFVCQGGDPTGTGSGGPGYAIRCEYNARRYDHPGVVGMALSGRDTGGSQFFLTHLPTPHLDYNYTIFAEMIRGDGVLERTSQYDALLKISLW